MASTAVKIGGQIVALAERHMPDYSFAAMVHRGEDVTLHLFKGRLLEGSSALAPGSKSLALFKELQGETAVKSGFFKRKSYLTARVCVRARGRKMSMQCNFDDASAYTPDTDSPRRAADIVLRDDVPDLAKSMFREALPDGLSPSAIAELFMADHTEWNTFAQAEAAFNDSEGQWNQRQSYDALVLRYCGPDKTYQGLAFGSEAPFNPANTTLVEERIEGDRAWVETHFQNPELDFISHDHQYEFTRDTADGNWRLVELWYRAAPDDLTPYL